MGPRGGVDVCHVTRYIIPVIKTLANRLTQELFGKGKVRGFPPDVATRAARKLEYVHLATCVDDLKVPPGNRFTCSAAIARGSTRLPSTTSGAFVFGLSTVTPTTLRFVTTIEGERSDERTQYQAHDASSHPSWRDAV